MRKTKTQKGITLIALIITIVVLIILAAVVINSITNDGIIGKAESVKDKYEQEQQKEQDMLEYYEQLLAGTVKYVKDVQEQVFTENTNVYDEYGNKIVVPAGFMITKDADTVEEGIVIQDATVDESGNATATNGSQFVWIPVGKVNSSIGTKTITLGRYIFATGSIDHDGDGTNETAGEIVTSLTKTNPSDQLKSKSTSTNYSTEGLKNETPKNKQARDIEAFITSANTKGGYYIGRYEARNNNGTVTTVASHTVWGSVNQATASSESRDMYGDGYTTGTFSSDLINSYAWDTAIVFLQEFDDRSPEAKATPYSRQTRTETSFSSTGTTTDIICNIYDMASNCQEWSTESYSYGSYICVFRGGDYISNDVTSSRNSSPTSNASAWDSFRPILYVAL